MYIHMAILIGMMMIYDDCYHCYCSSSSYYYCYHYYYFYLPVDLGLPHFRSKIKIFSEHLQRGRPCEDRFCKLLSYWLDQL